MAKLPHAEWVLAEKGDRLAQMLLIGELLDQHPKHPHWTFMRMSDALLEGKITEVTTDKGVMVLVPKDQAK